MVTDGELRRAHFTGAVSEVVSGLEDVPAAGHDWHGASDDDELRHTHRRAVTGHLRRTRSLAQEELVYLRARTAAQPKLTLPSPMKMQTFWSPEHSTAAYADPSRPRRRTSRTEGLEPLAEHRDGHWMAAGGYERISRAVFTRARGFDTFFLEYDDERSGGFEPLGDLPDEAVVVLGLVSTKRTALEDPRRLLARVEEAARFHPRDRLAVSPQCGFESALGSYPLDEAGQAAKLRLVREVADRAWPDDA